MEKFKVKVINKSEVLEIEKILSTIGMFSSDYSGFSYPKYIANNIDGEFSDYTMTDSGIDNFKLITIQELKDMVNQVQDEPFLTPETTINDQYAEIEQVRKHRHYFKDVSNIAEIDVYAVLKLFEVTDPCLQHIVKKALCAGKRGHKDMMEDLQNIVDTAIRAVELNS